MHGRRQRARRVLQLRLDDVPGQISRGRRGRFVGQAAQAVAGADQARGSNNYLGHFVDPKDAARAYDAAALERDPISMTNAKLGLLAETIEGEA
jgi:hypothetical protein